MICVCTCLRNPAVHWPQCRPADMAAQASGVWRFSCHEGLTARAARRMSDSSDSKGSDSWSEVEGTDRGPVVLRWERLVRKYRRIRRLQRYWHNIGQSLQNVSEAARKRVQSVWPAGRP